MALNFETLITAWPIIPVCTHLSNLKVPDVVPLDGSEISVEEIAARTGVDSGLLYRLLRMASGAGVFKESEGKKFSHTADSLKFATGGYWQSFMYFCTGPMMLNTLAALENQLKDPSKSAFEHHYQVPIFKYFEEKGLTEAFGEFMITRTKKNLPAALKYIEPLLGENVKVFADLGGNLGHFSLALCNRRHDLNAIVFDLPTIVRIGRSEAVSGTGFASQFDEDVRSRVSFVEGDFFKVEDYAAIAHADVFFFKCTLHNWNDERCSVILNNLYAVMKDDAQVIICDSVMSQVRNEHKQIQSIDLIMAVYFDAKERTKEEWETLIPSDKFSVSYSDCVDEYHEMRHIVLKKK